MNTNAIQLEDRFSDFELVQMFNVECAPHVGWERSSRKKYDDTSAYAFNDVKVPLLVTRKRKISKRVKHYNDAIKAGVTRHEPGTKGRVADLIAFYAVNAAGEVSAFDIEDDAE